MSDENQLKQKRLTKKQLKAAAFRSRKKIKEVLSSKSDDQLEVPEQDEDQEKQNQVSGRKIHKNDKKLEKSGKTKQNKNNDQSNSKNITGDTEKSNKQDDGDDNDDDSEKGDSSKESTDKVILGAAAKRRNRKKLSKLKEKNRDEKSSSKLILFIGNLPFDITKGQIQKFFLDHCDEEPIVRLMTDKSKPDSKPQNQRTKGCGFVEFKSSASLQKALRLHHTPIRTEFTGKESESSVGSSISKPRKINIELTAGGGGNSENRQKKINMSKERLSKQREKRIEQSLKQETEKRLKTGDQSDPSWDVSVKLGSNKRKRKDDGSADRDAKARLNDRANDQRPMKSLKPRPFTSGSNAIKLG
ncbi:hypothetical protein BY996DRAFT_6980943 [Phakopsora pachyrhizi]|uniref:RRM domain-containing protein n=1 Tax=Phakopsora pachyrhizi TaxID=170000 RepID=A0AAV0AGC5_PHAPC|nr:hypothetical protein BY996DRAFT_6980943 [Phakopsora pachyrhizi]CAH7666558.1 hypothetical protein PPACK8108_LOCUS916 [Phakopsora pachyrhizi]